MSLESKLGPKHIVPKDNSERKARRAAVLPYVVAGVAALVMEKPNNPETLKNSNCKHQARG